MTDKLLAIVTLTVFFAFVIMIISYIKEPDLIIISVLVMAGAAYDFWRTVSRSKDDA